MKKKWMRALAYMLVAAMITVNVPGFSVNAEDSSEETNYAESVFFTDISEYRKTTDTHTVTATGDTQEVYLSSGIPVKEGYIFAGWFKDKECKSELAETVTAGPAYAKIVPKEILGSKAQVGLGTTAESETAGLRFVSTVDSLRYQKIGFILEKVGGTKAVTTESNVVYESLYAGEADNQFISILPTVFHAASKRFFAVTVSGVTTAQQATLFKATPYWITLDGTKVTPAEEPAEKSVEMGVQANNASDILWYSDDETEFTLTTPEQLRGLAYLSQTKNFAGKTIRLGNDIAFNTTKGNASDWGTAPEGIQSWNPIGSGTAQFAGTFDGANHTVSGLYLKADAIMNVGFFGHITASAVVKNLNIENSYFENTPSAADTNAWGGNTGSAVAWSAGGTVINVSSSAIVKNGRDIGGIVGMSRNATGTIKNCAFTGEAGGAGIYVGGILGETVGDNNGGNPVDVMNCLFAGTITGTSTNAGGIVGMSYGASNYTGCLSVGTMTCTSTKGSVVGSNHYNTRTQMKTTNTYAATETCSGLMGGGSRPINGAVAVVKANLMGAAAETNAPNLDWTYSWKTVEGSTPILGSDVDTSWYDGSGDYVLYDLADFLGFNALATAETPNTFSGETIKLGADIIFNEEGSTARQWTVPYNTSKGFAGTLDGQGHAIKGFYVNATAAGAGLFNTIINGTVKNLEIDGTVTSTANVAGCIAGYVNNGTLENITSAVNVTGGQETGGLIGRVFAQTKITSILNCSYAGTVNSSMSNDSACVGGLIGKHQNGKLVIENCELSGAVNTSVGGIVGGFVGQEASTDSKDGQLSITDSVVSGDVTSARHNSCVGGVIGQSSTTFKVSVKDTVVTGNVTGKQWVGGIVSQITKGTVNIEHCYVGGAVSSSVNYGGGLVGELKGGTLTLKDCAAVGTFGTVSTDNMGQLIGRVLTESTRFTIDNCYGINNGYRVVGAKQYPVNLVSDVSLLLPASTNQDILKAYYDAGIIPDIAKFTDYAGTDKFEIGTEDELYAFNIVALAQNFSGKTVKLTSDITVNSGNANEWGTKAPKKPWNSIPSFNGIFDGQGHTISGLYNKTTGKSGAGFINWIDSATIQDFTLANSYFEVGEDGGNQYQYNGSVVCFVSNNTSTISKVRSSAILVGNKQSTGGIVGKVNSSKATLNISECWFDGVLQARCSFDGCVEGLNDHGLWTGGIIGYIQNAVSVSISDCMYSGLIISECKKNAQQAGGIVGRQGSGNQATIERCFSNGQFAVLDGGSGNGFSTIIDYGANDGRLNDLQASGNYGIYANVINSGSHAGYSRNQNLHGSANITDTSDMAAAAPKLFEGADAKWVLGADGMPVLKCFDTTNAVATSYLYFGSKNEVSAPAPSVSTYATAAQVTYNSTPVEGADGQYTVDRVVGENYNLINQDYGGNTYMTKFSEVQKKNI